MPEGINLASPYHVTPGTGQLRVAGFEMRRYNLSPNGEPILSPLVRISMIGDNGELLHADITGDAAVQIMQQMNTANFTLVSLRRRLIERFMQERPDIAGSIVDIADVIPAGAMRSLARRPIPDDLSGLLVEDLASLANEHQVSPAKGSGSGGRVLRKDLEKALTAARAGSEA